eukprot:COSAG02_NODE_65542_length_258_cov_0.138365_1_plen_46_part_10
MLHQMEAARHLQGAWLQLLKPYHRGKKTALFEPFIYKNQHFAKTGS